MSHREFQGDHDWLGEQRARRREKSNAARDARAALRKDRRNKQEQQQKAKQQNKNKDNQKEKQNNGEQAQEEEKIDIVDLTTPQPSNNNNNSSNNSNSNSNSSSSNSNSNSNKEKEKVLTEKFNDKDVRIYKKKTGTCFICYNNNTTLVTISKNCTHEPRYCLTCIAKTIESEISQKGVSNFSCTYSNCHTKYEHFDFYCLLNKAKLNILDKITTHRCLEKMTEFRWCKNPKGCGNGQLVSNWEDLRGYYACNVCEQPMCFQHEIAWHNGFTCDEYQKELNNNNNFGSSEILASFTKKCPNDKCNSKIAKLAGCDVMACCMYGTHGCQQNVKNFKECDHGGKQYCGQVFCWKCLGKIDINKRNGHRAYIRHCKPNCTYAALN